MTTNDGNNALARYQYLLRTSAPEDIEKAHEQAFAAMTDDERKQVLQALAANGAQATDSSAASLARAATRTEIQQPGTLERIFGSNSGVGTNLLTSVAGGFVGSAVWSGLTGGDGLGGRPGLLSRLLGLGRSNYGYGGGMMGGQAPMGGQGGGLFGGGGIFGGGGPFGGRGGQGGGMFGGGGPGGGLFGGGGGGGMFGGGPGGPGGPGGGPGGPGGGGPGGPGF